MPGKPDIGRPAKNTNGLRYSKPKVYNEKAARWAAFFSLGFLGFQNNSQQQRVSIVNALIFNKKAA
jgi:hypothetical protein